MHALRLQRKASLNPRNLPSALSRYVKTVCKLLLYLKVVDALWTFFGEGTTSRVFTAGAAAKVAAVNAISACKVCKRDLLRAAIPSEEIERTRLSAVKALRTEIRD